MDRRAALIVEFAIVGPLFFGLLFFVFDTAYIFYLQGVLDTALQATARKIQVGGAQDANEQTQNGLDTYGLCPNALGLLNCSDLFIRVERFNPTTCPGGASACDIYDDTNGVLPGSGGALGLSLYGGVGTTPSPTPGPGAYDYASSSGGFCVAGGSATTPEYIILTAVYVTPSFLSGLIPNSITYNGKIMRAMLSSAAFITEPFSNTYSGGAAC